MVENVTYTSIKRVLDNILDHPMLKGVDLDKAIRYTIRFISLHGYPALYQDKITYVDIDDNRGVLPCDLVSIVQVRDKEHRIPLRAMTDTFPDGLRPAPQKKCMGRDQVNNMLDPKERDLFYLYKYPNLEMSFKTQGRFIYTSFPKGSVEIAYKAIPVDEHGYPMLIDNEVYLNALEAYIKMKVFTVKFDHGDITAGVLQNAQQDYAVAAGELKTVMTMPSLSEMESITRMINTLIPNVTEFDRSFRNLGDREYIRRH